MVSHAVSTLREVQIGFTFVLCCLPTGNVLAERTVGRQAIADAWSARATHVHSFRFVVSQSETLAKGSAMDATWPERKNPKHLTVPEDTTVRDTSFTFVMDGDKSRYECNGLGVSHEKGLLPQKAIDVHDGKIRGLYLAPGASEIPQGTIEETNTSTVLSTITVIPLIMTYRPFCSAPSGILRTHLLDPNYFIVNAAPLSIRGRPCILLKELPSPAKSSTRSLWLDPGREFLLMRYTLETNGKAVCQMDFTEYRKESVAWVPTKWQIQFMGRDSSIDKCIMAVVTEYSLNPSVDPLTFQPSFPPGTLVTDHVWNGGRGATNKYIVREGGQKRIVTDAEVMASYDQLVATESGMAMKSKKGPGAWTYLAISGFVMCMVAVSIMLLRRLRSRAV